jgi:hypothetical protein
VEGVLSGLPLAAAAAGGILATYLCEDEAPLSIRVCAGIPVGIAFFGVAALLLASGLGLAPTSAWLAAALAGSPLLLLLQPQVRGRGRGELARAWSRLRTPTRGDAAGIVAGLALAWVLFSVFDRAAFEQDGGLLTGIDHNIGDLPFHVGVIMGFARGDNLPPEHPELAGMRLTYPILADFVVAQLLMTGMDLRDALLAQNLLLAGALAGLLACFARVLTGDAGAARLAPWLLFLSGGLGFGLAAGDWMASGKPLPEFLLDLPRDYTITWTGELRWGNVLTTLLVPQRALLLGAPIAVLAFILVWTALNDPSEATARRRLRAAGIAAGLLPLAHVHAFLVTLGMAAVVAVLFQRLRAFVHFFGPALLLSAPQVAWLAADSGVQAGSVLAWQFGWDRGGRNPVWFWLDNAGLLLPLQAWALWRARRTPLVRFQVPFLLLFAAANLLRLSPWIWDNIKFLFFWHVAALPMVAGLLASLWRQRGARRLASGALTVSLLLAGGLDVWRVASRQITLPIFEREARALAAGPLAATPPRALILHAPVPNSPVYLAGRRSLLGYPGHIWSQGLDAGDREQRLRHIYAGAPEAADLLARSEVDYVLVGPQERRWTRVDEAFLGRFPLAAEHGPYRLLKVR